MTFIIRKKCHKNMSKTLFLLEWVFNSWLDFNPNEERWPDLKIFDAHLYVGFPVISNMDFLYFQFFTHTRCTKTSFFIEPKEKWPRFLGSWNIFLTVLYLYTLLYKKHRKKTCMNELRTQMWHHLRLAFLFLEEYPNESKKENGGNESNLTDCHFSCSTDLLLEKDSPGDSSQCPSLQELKWMTTIKRKSFMLFSLPFIPLLFSYTFLCPRITLICPKASISHFPFAFIICIHLFSHSEGFISDMYSFPFILCLFFTLSVFSIFRSGHVSVFPLSFCVDYQGVCWKSVWF